MHLVFYQEQFLSIFKRGKPRELSLWVHRHQSPVRKQINYGEGNFTLTNLTIKNFSEICPKIDSVANKSKCLHFFPLLATSCRT